MSKNATTVARRSSHCYAAGDRVRWNYWTDRRESGWHYGTIIDGPFAMFGEVGYKIRHDADPANGIREYESISNAKLLEYAPCPSCGGEWTQGMVLYGCDVCDKDCCSECSDTCGEKNPVCDDCIDDGYEDGYRQSRDG